MKAMADLTGMKFGRWTVLKFAEARCTPCGKRRLMWECQCECGTVRLVEGSRLTGGYSKSCGCLIGDYNKENKTKHGKRNTKLYKTWISMKDRCSNPNTEAFKDYGKRGIKVCDEWASDFGKFYDWSIKNGYKNGLTIDRINVNGNYEPSNCRWSTMKEQNNNRRSNHYITYKGKTQTISQWETELGFKKDILSSRLSLGWSVEKAIETPYKNRKFRHEYGYSKIILNRHVKIGEEDHSISEWCKIFNINKRTVLSRIEKGYSDYDALVTPVKK